MTKTYFIHKRELFNSAKALCKQLKYDFKVVAMYHYGFEMHWQVEIKKPMR